MTRLSRIGVALAFAALLAGCGGSQPTPAGTPAVTLTLVAQNLAFDQTKLTVPANLTFAITLDNRDAAPHNVNITGGATRETEPFGGPASKTYVYAALPEGSYTFLCSVHPDMKGTLLSTTTMQP